jgi:hypothetical protein
LRLVEARGNIGGSGIHSFAPQEQGIMRSCRILAFGACLAASGGPWSVATTSAQVIATRPLGPIIHLTTDSLGLVWGVRVLSDGRLLANDFSSRRIALYDSTLRFVRNVVDNSGATVKMYGSQAGGLLPFTADSSLYLDLGAQSVVLLAPDGSIGRTASLPTPSGIELYSLPTGARSDNIGDWLIPKGHVPAMWSRPNLIPLGTEGMIWSDSTQILRVNVATHNVDTVATARNYSAAWGYHTNESAGLIYLTAPLNVSDDWTVLSDGTVAVVRNFDLHIDWFAPNGSRTSTGKIPHEWVRLTDSLKDALIDSLTRIDSGRFADQLRDKPRQDSIARARGQPTRDPMPPHELAASDLPDYYPAVAPGSTWADKDDNVWIPLRAAVKQPGGTVYDVVNRSGALIDRVQVPGGTSIIAFGRGVVYLTSRVGTGYQIAVARIR